MSNTYMSRTVNGYRIDIHHSERTEPRDGASYGLFVMFKDVGWVGADQYIDRHGRSLCWNCDGEGSACPVCHGEGEVVAETTFEWIEALNHAFHGRLTMPVIREEHGNSVYRILHHWDNDDGLDSRVVGFLIYTNEHITTWGFSPNAPTKLLLESMDEEMKEFTHWANGNVWGFTVVKPDGEIADSCDGFIGEPDGEVLDEAILVANYWPTATPLYTVQLEAAEIALLYFWLSEARSPLADGTLIKLRNAFPKGQDSDI